MVKIVEASLVTGEKILLDADTPFIVSKQTFTLIGVGLIAGVITDHPAHAVCIWREKDGVYRNLVSFALADSKDGTICIGAIMGGVHNLPPDESGFPDCSMN